MVHSSKPSLSACAFGAGAAHVAALAIILPIMITLPAPVDTASRVVAIRVAVATAAPDASAPATDPIAAALGPSGMGAMTLATPETEVVEGEGDLDEVSLPKPALDDITAALPAISQGTAPPEHAALPAPAAPVEPAGPAEAVTPAEPAAIAEPFVQSLPAPAPASLPARGAAPDTVASIEPAEAGAADMPYETYEAYEPDAANSTGAIVPLPLRKPRPSVAAVAPPAPATPVVERPKPAPAKPVVVRKFQSQKSVGSQPQKSAGSQKPGVKGIFGGRRATTMQEYRIPGG